MNPVSNMGGAARVFADFTNPCTRTYWKEMLKENVLEYGTSLCGTTTVNMTAWWIRTAGVDFEGKGGTIPPAKSVMSNIMCHITDEAIHETS